MRKENVFAAGSVASYMAFRRSRIEPVGDNLAYEAVSAALAVPEFETITPRSVSALKELHCLDDKSGPASVCTMYYV